MHDARRYFASCDDKAAKLKSLQKKVNEPESTESQIADEQKLKTLQRELDTGRQERLARVNDATTTLLSLTEGHNLDDTLEQSAKSLGTVLLITQGNAGQFAHFHQTLKPFYKAILSLWLSDAILLGGNIKHKYLSQYIEATTRFTGNRHWQQRW